MLPDYPKQKSELMKLLLKRFSETVRGGFMKEIQTTIVEEGEEEEIVRKDQVPETTELERISLDFQFSESEAGKLTPNEVLQRFDQTAMDMRGQMVRKLFKAVEEISHKTGNVISGEKGITPQSILDMTEAVDIDFENGKPRMPQLVLAPNLIPQAQAAFREIENDPEWMRKFNELIELKRNEWAAREADYKLVG